jgi:hypothetical protein
MTARRSTEWLIRQFQYLQLYFKRLFLLFMMVSFPYILLMLFTPFVFFYGLVYQDWGAITGGLTFLFSMLMVSWLVQRAIPVKPTDFDSNDRQYKLTLWLLVTPVAVLVMGWALIKTMLRVKRGLLTMQWCSVKYRVDTRTRRVVEIIR